MELATVFLMVLSNVHGGAIFHRLAMNTKILVKSPTKRQGPLDIRLIITLKALINDIN